MTTDSSPFTESYRPTVLVAGEGFGADNIAKCTLCIEIDDSRFRFCFVEEYSMRCLWLEDYAFDTFLNETEYLDRLKTLVARHPYLPSDQWKDVHISVNTPAFTMIPAPLFRKEYAADYLRLATGTGVADDSRVLYHLIPYVNAHTVFTVPNRWSDWLLSLYPLQNIEFYHLASPLVIGTIVSHAELGLPRLMTVHLETSHFTLVQSDERQLKFCNRFPYQNPLELSYLVLFTMNQLQILPEDVDVVLYGEITPYSDIYSELVRFLPKLQFGRFPSTLRYITEFDDIPGHRYFGLLNTFLVPS